MTVDTPVEESLFQAIVRWVMIPIGYLGGMLGLVVLFGLFYLWQYPSLASMNNVEVRDLVARSINPHWGDPFYVLKGRDEWEKARNDWNVSDDGSQRVSGDVTLHPKGDGKQKRHYAYEIRKGGKPAFEKISTAPCTNVSNTDLDKSQKDLEEWFNYKTNKNKEQVVNWGHSIYFFWMRSVEDRIRNNPDFITYNIGNEDEFLWVAWKQLHADLPTAEKDLPRLAKLTKEAFPNKADHDAAIAWAKTLYERMDHVWKERNGNNNQQKVALATALPPANDFTYQWLLYQYVGLTDETRPLIRKRWLSYFREGKEKDVLAWGKELEKERREAKEPLPPSSDKLADNIALLCVIERQRGSDAYGEKCRQILAKEIGPSSYGVISPVVSLGAYPNDDFYTIFAGNDPFESLEIPASRWIIIVCQLMMLFGLKACVFYIIAEQWLKLKKSTLYLSWRAKQKPFFRDPIVLLTYLVVPFLAWLASFLTVPRDVELMVSPFNRLVGVYLAVWLGGTLLTVLSRLVSVLLIKVGIDPEHTWLDEAISIPLGVFVLFHFENDFLSIFFNLMIDVLPELGRRYQDRLPACLRAQRPQQRPEELKREERRRSSEEKPRKGVNVASVWEARNKKPRES